MSTTTTVTVHCDVCAQWTDGSDHSMTVRHARRAARQWGWIYKKGPRGMIDVCPDCQAAKP